MGSRDPQRSGWLVQTSLVLLAISCNGGRAGAGRAGETPAGPVAPTPVQPSPGAPTPSLAADLQPGQARGSQALFDEVWSVFDRTYPYFEHKGIDWRAVADRHRPEFAEDLSPALFAQRLAATLAELRDWHVFVTGPDGTVSGYSAEIRRNYTSAPRNRYAPRGYRTLGDRVVWHGWLEGDVAYIRIESLDGQAFQAIGEEALEQMFVEYRRARGLILDLRPNSGGDERVAQRIAGHFTTRPVPYGYTQVRTGPGHADLGPRRQKVLEPAALNSFEGPTAVLVGQRCMSSAEWFALMMRACPNVRLVGDRTRGASSNPRTERLANGVSYTVSTWMALTAAGQPIEDRGIQPDLPVDADRSFDEARDYVVERALEAVRDGFGSAPPAPTPASRTGPRGTPPDPGPADGDLPGPGFDPLPRNFDPHAR